MKDAQGFIIWLFSVCCIIAGLYAYNNLNFGGWSFLFGIAVGSIAVGLIVGVIALIANNIDLIIGAFAEATKWTLIGFFIGLGIAFSNWVLRLF